MPNENEVQQVIDQLVKDVTDLTKHGAEEVRAWAAKAAPELVEYSTLLAQAKAAGNADDVQRHQTSIEQVKNSAVLDAAILGVQAQATLENGLLAIIDKAIALVGKL